MSLNLYTQCMLYSKHIIQGQAKSKKRQNLRRITQGVLQVGHQGRRQRPGQRVHLQEADLSCQRQWQEKRQKQ